jgi:hypothetical protein
LQARQAPPTNGVAGLRGAGTGALRGTGRVGQRHARKPPSGPQRSSRTSMTTAACTEHQYCAARNG